MTFRISFRKLIVLLAVMVCAMAVFAPLSPAQAQGGFTYVFNFGDSDQGWAAQDYGNPNPYGVYLDHTGWTYGCNGDTYVETDIRYAFSAGFTVTSIDVLFDRTLGDQSPIVLTDALYHDNFDEPNRFVFQDDTVLGSGSGLHLTWTGSQALSSGELGVELATAYDGSSGDHCSTINKGSLLIKAITITGTGDSPFPTKTPFPTPGDISSGGPAILVCGAPMGNDGLFNNFPGNWRVVGTALNVPGTNTGVKIEDGEILLGVNIDGLQNYILTTHYHLTDTFEPPNFIISIGSSNPLTVQVNPTLDPQSTTFPAAQYQPDDGSPQGTATITVLTTAIENPTLIIDQICLTKQGDTVIGVPPDVSQVCASISYNATGDLLHDIPALFHYLISLITNLWQCVLYPLLLGLWQTIQNMLGVLSNTATWIVQTVQLIVYWIIALTVGFIYYVIGSTLNVAVIVANALLNAFNSLGLGILINYILLALSNLPALLGSIITNIPLIIGAIASFVTTIIGIVFSYAGQVIHIIWSIISAIPVIITSIITGFNAPANTTIPAWFPDCNNHNSLLYGPCLGAYVLDNTLWDGPLFYLIPILSGFMALNTVLWAMEEIKDSMRQ